MRKRIQEGATLRTQVLGLGRVDIGMLEGKQGSLCVEGANVVGRSHLVDLGDQGGGTEHVADTNARQAEFAQRPHQQHMGVARQTIDVAAAGERLIGLVDHHQAWRHLHDALDDVVVPQIGRGVVRVSQVNDGGLVLAESR